MGCFVEMIERHLEGTSKVVRFMVQLRMGRSFGLEGVELGVQSSNDFRIPD